MRITLVGAGNLATNLSLALREAGHEIVQVYSRTETSASALADQLGCPWTTDLPQVETDVDCVILSVKDSVLGELARGLRSSNALYAHTAGSMPLDTLPQTRRAVLYPMQTFSKTRRVDFREIPCFLETARTEDMPLLRELAGSVSDHLYELSTEKRKYLHLAAVFACNFVNHCYDLSAQVLEPEGIPFEVMLPLIDETARKVHELAPREAQTGPAIRWDENVIGKQMSLLASNPSMQEIYQALSRSIHERKK